MDDERETRRKVWKQLLSMNKYDTECHDHVACVVVLTTKRYRLISRCSKLLLLFNDTYHLSPLHYQNEFKKTNLLISSNQYKT